MIFFRTYKRGVKITLFLKEVKETVVIGSKSGHLPISKPCAPPAGVWKSISWVILVNQLRHSYGWRQEKGFMQVFSVRLSCQH